MIRRIQSWHFGASPQHEHFGEPIDREPLDDPYDGEALGYEAGQIINIEDLRKGENTNG